MLRKGLSFALLSKTEQSKAVCKIFLRIFCVDDAHRSGLRGRAQRVSWFKKKNDLRLQVEADYGSCELVECYDLG